MFPAGFLLGKGFGLEHGADCDLNIAASSGSDRAHESGSIVLHFALHLVVDLGRERADQDGMRRARIGSGSHGGDVGGFEDEDTRRTGAAAGGGDVEDDGNGGVRDLIDNLASGLDETSGSIDLDPYSLIVAALSFVDSAGNIFLGNRLDGVVDDNLENFGTRERIEKKNGGQAEKHSRNQSSFHESPIASLVLVFLLLFVDCDSYFW